MKLTLIDNYKAVYFPYKIVAFIKKEGKEIPSESQQIHSICRTLNITKHQQRLYNFSNIDNLIHHLNVSHD